MRSVAPSPIDGTVRAPPSKSLTQRAVAAALLADGVSEVMSPSDCDDARAAVGMAEALGAVISHGVGGLSVTGGLSAKTDRLDAGESGLSLRMFSAIAALCEHEITISGRGSLLSRPVGMVEHPLATLGASVRTCNGFPPITVRGPLNGGTAHVDGSLSSQFLSGLLIALPAAPADSTLVVRGLKSSPYVRMTLDVIRAFGIRAWHDAGAGTFRVPGRQKYRPARFEVEGDWSGAANLLVAGALAGRVTATGLASDSQQADRAIVDALRASCASIEFSEGGVSCGRGEPRAFDFDATDCPDLFPPLLALAVHCPGRSRIAGASRLVHKESNRAEVLVSEFSRIGAQVRVAGDSIDVDGGPLAGGTADAHGDHRIAMALAVAGLASRDGVTIAGSESVSKSYPRFFQDLQTLGAAVN